MMDLFGSGIRYFGGAIICALINNAILIVGDAFGSPDLASVLIAWLVGGTVGYFWHSHITFQQTLATRSYARFMAGMTFGIPLTWLSILFFRHVIGWPMALSSPATTVVLVVYNYLNARFAILIRKRKSEPVETVKSD